MTFLFFFLLSEQLGRVFDFVALKFLDADDGNRSCKISKTSAEDRAQVFNWKTEILSERSALTATIALMQTFIAHWSGYSHSSPCRISFAKLYLIETNARCPSK